MVQRKWVVWSVALLLVTAFVPGFSVLADCGGCGGCQGKASAKEAGCCGQGHGQGRGAGRRGGGGHHENIHGLLDHHEAIVRHVEEIEGGVETVTTSEDPQVTTMIREHVREMKQRVESGRDPGRQRVRRRRARAGPAADAAAGGVSSTLGSVSGKISASIAAFLDGGPFAVVGASRDRRKYGNKVLRCYLQHGRVVYPVNPNAEEVERLRAYPSLASLPEPVHGVSMITQPGVTERAVERLPAAGASWVWMQPGAESERAVARAGELGIGVISGGPCLLVALGFREEP
jgi:predicted CoA-binding protein